MCRYLALLILLPATLIAYAAPPAASPTWQTRVAQTMPLLGHRNWVLIVDSAYPLQTSPGVETIETNAGQLEVVRTILGQIDASIHVRPLIYMDSELPFVPDADAPGASAYRAQIGALLHPFPIESRPHDQILTNIADAGRQFHVLVLKTRMTIPYTSVFIRLDCKYWSADDENRMRARMAAAPPTQGQSGSDTPSH